MSGIINHLCTWPCSLHKLVISEGYTLSKRSTSCLTDRSCLNSSLLIPSTGISLTWKQNLKQNHGKRCVPPKSNIQALSIKAVQGSQRPRRLIEVIRLIPELSRNYFKSPFRRALFGGISLLGGFYVAQTISLSFGALGVNDVIAAVLCVIVTEYVTRFYYTRPKVTFTVALLNNFKMGFTYGLFIDAFKLAS